MIQQFKYNSVKDLPKSINVKAKCPSNIALIKYWGKKEIQIPTNPSISFTLKNCFTETKLELQRGNEFNIKVLVDGQETPSFIPKIQNYFERIKLYCPYIFDYKISVDTKNTFPHSSGIASSASGFGALSMCVMQIEQHLTNCSDEIKLKKASFLSRLGSGSASRSIYGPLAAWGNHEKIKNSSDFFAVKFSDINSIFKDYQDTILLVDKGTKQVSSTIGHNLMNNHPYASQRFLEANSQLDKLMKVLKSGDLKEFINITEQEALSLHAMMMTSNPYFILMKEGTISIINKIWRFRKSTAVPVSFTLDAGANVHVLYPSSYKQKVLDFIDSELVAYCENQQYICDEIGNGAEILNENYA